MGRFERLRKSALSLGTYLYEHSVKLMKIHGWPRFLLLWNTVMVSTQECFKTLLLESISCLSGNKFRFICFINEKPNSI